MARLVIAVDGPAASGKGTVAARLAAHYNLPHLDTGSLYRATAKKALDALKIAYGRDAFQLTDITHTMLITEAAQSLSPSDLTVPNLDSEQIGQSASLISALPDVRAALLNYQRNFAAQADGAVLDGRDIGTVICPDATVKLYIIADARVRAERRFKQQQLLDPKAKYENILADIKARDERDTNRKAAPLKPAKDAVHLDTSKLTADEVFTQALAMVEKKRR